MANIFQVDVRESRMLAMWYLRAPKEFARGTAMMLNNQAFATRSLAIEEIATSMTARSIPFISRQLRVTERAKGNQPMMRQRSAVASLSAPRFTGWLEQETGAKLPQDRRAYAIGARRGVAKKKVSPKFRMRRGRRYLGPRDLGTKSIRRKSVHHAAQVMLIWTFREKWKDPFVISGHNSLADGLYAWVGGKLRMLHSFDDDMQPKRNRWMTRARKGFSKRVDLRREWGIVINSVMKRRRR